MTKEQRRFAPTRVSEITGLGVQIEMESVSGFDWIHCPDSVEYTCVMPSPPGESIIMYDNVLYHT
jgi:hypothetical protein